MSSSKRSTAVTKRKNIISIRRPLKRSWSATHISMDLFEKPALFVTFDGSFCQKLGPLYSPNGPMLEFEVSGDQNFLIDLQKVFLEIKSKIVHLSGNDLKHDAGAPIDKAKTDTPYFVPYLLMD